MTTSGWIIMLASVGIVTGVFILCLYKVLTGGDTAEHMHGLEQETPDTDESSN